MPVFRRLLTLTAIGILAASTPVLAGPGEAGHSHGHGGETAYGKPGDPKRPARTVLIRMGEGDGKMYFSPARVEIRRGEQIRFRITNDGALDHELVVATLEENLKHAEEMKKNPDMEHDDPNAKRLSPKKTGDILWQFTKTGEFNFSCLIPGHREAGMTGNIVVK